MGHVFGNVGSALLGVWCMCIDMAAASPCESHLSPAYIICLPVYGSVLSKG
jgi:hypothetical protein